MWWNNPKVSEPLTLDENYDNVLTGGSTLEVVIPPTGKVQVLADFNPEATPSENCDLRIVRSHDGSTWETDGEAERFIIGFAEDPARRSIEISGCYAVKFRARVRDTDDTAGTDDTASTLTIRYRVLDPS